MERNLSDDCRVNYRIIFPACKRDKTERGGHRIFADFRLLPYFRAREKSFNEILRRWVETVAVKFRMHNFPEKR